MQVVCIRSSPADATTFPKTPTFMPHLNPDWFYLSGTSLPRLSWKRGRSTDVIVVVVVVAVVVVRLHSMHTHCMHTVHGCSLLLQM